MNRRSLLGAVIGSMLSIALLGAAHAAVPFPNAPVRIIVPVAAGGSMDQLARILAKGLTARWHESVIVQNMPGATNIIGSTYVAHAPADGYTLLLNGESLSLNVVQKGKSLPYNPVTDLRGITKAVVNPQLLVAREGLGVKTFAQFADLVRSKPGQITVGLPGGTGSLQDLAMALLDQRIGAKTNQIPYPGGGPAMLDVLGEHIDAMLITLAAATNNVRAGKLVALAVTTPDRSKALPDVPTLQQAGLKDYVIESWQGLLAPAKTPQAIIDKINRDTVATLRDRATTRQLEDLGYNVVASSPAEVDHTVSSDIKTYEGIVKATGLHLE